MLNLGHAVQAGCRPAESHGRKEELDGGIRVQLASAAAAIVSHTLHKLDTSAALSVHMKMRKFM